MCSLISEARVVPKTPRVFGTAVPIASVTVAVVVLALSDAPARQSGELAAARVSHVGIVTRDIDATLREYVNRVQRVHPPALRGGDAQISVVFINRELIQRLSRDMPVGNQINTPIFREIKLENRSRWS